MALIEKRLATRTDLKWFGILFAAFFGLLGLWSWWRADVYLRIAPILLWSIGVVVAVLYYGIRSLQQPFYSLCLAITYPIGWTISHLIMLIVFYAVITPVGWALRLWGYDSMHRAFDPAARSYWVARGQSRSKRRYFQQF